MLARKFLLYLPFNFVKIYKIYICIKYMRAGLAILAMTYAPTDIQQHSQLLDVNKHTAFRERTYKQFKGLRVRASIHTQSTSKFIPNRRTGLFYGQTTVQHTHTRFQNLFRVNAPLEILGIYEIFPNGQTILIYGQTC